jgi:hypothetical protein
MAAFLFRCPTTGFRVQGWVADNGSAADGEAFESVECLACRGFHFVNPKTGKTLGFDDD